MSRDRKQEFLRSSVSAITARGAWITQGKPVSLWVSPVTQGIQVLQVLQALEIPGLPELAGSFLPLRIPGPPRLWRDAAACSSPAVPSPQLLTSACCAPQKVRHKYHGTDGTCLENVVYKDTLRSPYVLNHLCISENIYIFSVYIYNRSSYSQFLKLNLKIIKIAFLVKNWIR